MAPAAIHPPDRRSPTAPECQRTSTPQLTPVCARAGIRITYLLAQLDIVRLRAILGCQQVPNRKQHQEQLDSRPDGVILVTRLHVAQEDGGTGNLMELFAGGVDERHHMLGDVGSIHDGG